MISKYGYIYITENLINHKKYIGQHKAQEFDPYYLGSGLALNNAINKYGRDNFKAQILEWCDSPDSLNIQEAYWIEFYHADVSREFYNIRPGGYSYPMPESTKEKLRIAQSDYQKKHGNPMKGRRHSEESKEKNRQSHLGKKMTKEARQNMGRSQKGRHHSIETRKKMSDFNKEFQNRPEIKRKKSEALSGEHNPRFGKHNTEEHKRRMKEGFDKKVCKAVRCVETGEIFPSLMTLERTKGYHHGNISVAIKENLIRYNYHWEYV